MKCEEAAEFISALCDGETIPRSEAEHIGECAVCRARLREYADIGAELRRIASLEGANQEIGNPGRTEPARRREWEKTERVRPSLWWKGWQTMRIPRFVFALLLAVIVVLGSSLVIVKARARTRGNVLMLAVKLPNGKSARCPLSLEDGKFAPCATMGPGYFYQFRPIARNGDRVEIGVHVGSWTPATTGPAADRVISLNSLVDGVQETVYWFEPGEKLEIPFPGSGTMVITGELMDHMPSLIPSEPDEPLDPKPGELRFASPVLLRGKEVVFDDEGATATADQEGQGVELYAPDEGLYHISLSPLEGAVEGRVRQSRVSFELNGQAYTFLLAAPVTRRERVWILLDASYKPTEAERHGGFLGSTDESQFLAKPSVAK